MSEEDETVTLPKLEDERLLLKAEKAAGREFASALHDIGVEVGLAAGQVLTRDTLPAVKAKLAELADLQARVRALEAWRDRLNDTWDRYSRGDLNREELEGFIVDGWLDKQPDPKP